MNTIELEKLVRAIVEQVLTKLLDENPALHFGPKKSSPEASRNHSIIKKSTGQPLAGSTRPARNTPTELIIEQHLITENDLIELARQGVSRLVVTKTAILTPSAQDLARDKKITIQRGLKQSANQKLPDSGGQPSSVIALLAPRCSQSEKNAVIENIIQAGYQVFEITVDRLLRTDVALALNELAEKIAAGFYKYGIVIDENALSLSIQANKIKNIRAVVCWDIASAKISREESQANLLLLNHYLLGLKSLQAITKTWLTA